METLTIEVKPELAHRWKEIAESEGRDLEAVISDAMEERAARQAAEDAEDVADALRVLAETPREDFILWETVQAQMEAERVA